MLYMLDTDITSYLLKKNHHHHQTVLNKLKKLSPKDVSISVFTACELFAGIEKIPSEQQQYKQKITDAVEYFLSSINILDTTMKSARIYGQLYAKLNALGQTIGTFDTLIAAHAIAENLTLITNNSKHFMQIKDHKIAPLKLKLWIH